MKKQPKFNDIFAAHDDAAEMAAFARIVWAETTSEMESCKALDVATKSRLATIERYARYRTEYHFIYPVCMKDGPTNKSDSGGQYVNMAWAMLNKLDERLLKYDAIFTGWTKGAIVNPQNDKPLKQPVAADEFLARASGLTWDDYCLKNGIDGSKGTPPYSKN